MKWCHNFSQDNAKLSHCLLGNEKKFSQIFYDTDYEELARDQIPQQYGGSVDQNLYCHKFKQNYIDQMNYTKVTNQLD